MRLNHVMSASPIAVFELPSDELAAARGCQLPGRGIAPPISQQRGRNVSLYLAPVDIFTRPDVCGQFRGGDVAQRIIGDIGDMSIQILLYRSR